MSCFLFSGLDGETLAKVEKSLNAPHTIAKGSELYRVGFIGILNSGQAKVCRTNEEGNVVTVRNITNGEVFGVASVFGDWKEGKSNIIAESLCEVLYISESELRRLIIGYPQIAFNYISFLSDRIRFLNQRIDAFSAGSTVQKLYEFLVSAADAQRKVVLSFGLAELARRLKMGRSSLYRSLDCLEENGLILRNKNTFLIK